VLTFIHYVMVEWIAPPLFLLEVAGANLNPKAGCTERFLVALSFFFQANTMLVPCVRPCINVSCYVP